MRIGVLSSSVDEFEKSDDVYDAIGDILQSVDLQKPDQNIRDLCSQFYQIMQVNTKPRVKELSGQKMLNAPINMYELIRNTEGKDKNGVQSIWVMNKENLGNVSKLEASYFCFIFLLSLSFPISISITCRKLMLKNWKKPKPKYNQN